MTETPKPKRKRPSKEQMDERLIVPLDPEQFTEGVLQAGPHPDERDEDDAPER